VSIKRKELNIIRLLAHHPDLQNLIQNELDDLMLQWTSENILPGSQSQVLDKVLKQDATVFIEELYDNIWAAVLEDENWHEDSSLAQYTQNALPNANSPYGYRLILRNNTPTLISHKPEADAVRLIYFWYVELDYSLRDIAHALTTMGIPTPYDIHQKRKSSTAWANWDMTVIHRIVSSPTYIGQWTYYDGHLGEQVTIQVPAQISAKTFEKAQKRLLANRNQPQHTLKYQYLFAFRTHCGCCGASIQLYAQRSGETVYRYYRCPTLKCRTRGFRADEVDPIAWRWLRTLFANEADMQKLNKAFQTRKEKRIFEAASRLQVVNQYLDEYRQQQQNLFDLSLPDNFLKESLAAFQTRLRLALQILEANRHGIIDELEELHITKLELAEADNNFSVQREIVSLLDAQLTIRGRNQDRQIEITCLLGAATIQLQKE
jgi:hypothetical protein